MSAEGPFLIIAAFWQDTDNTPEVAEAVSHKKFPEPEGWPRGAVVAFRREVAQSFAFADTLRQLDLDELNAAPKIVREAPSTHSERTA